MLHNLTFCVLFSPCFLHSESCAAQNNCYTRHLSKILIHLAWCLQECFSTSGVPPSSYMKAINATYISSVFLKYLIENAKTDTFEELYLSLDQSEAVPSNFSQGDSLAPYNGLFAFFLSWYFCVCLCMAFGVCGCVHCFQKGLSKYICMACLLAFVKGFWNNRSFRFIVSSG